MTIPQIMEHREKENVSIKNNRKNMVLTRSFQQRTRRCPKCGKEGIKPKEEEKHMNDCLLGVIISGFTEILGAKEKEINELKKRVEKQKSK